MLNTMHDGRPVLHGAGVSGDAHDHGRQLHQARIVITTARLPRYIFEKHHILFLVREIYIQSYVLYFHYFLAHQHFTEHLMCIQQNNPIV